MCIRDRTTADPQPALDDVKEKFEQALKQGSQEEMTIHGFCDAMPVSYTHLDVYKRQL